MENTQPHIKRQRAQGVRAALASALFLGMAPVFGKQAIVFGMPPLTVVAMRTILAAMLLFVVLLIFKRSYLYIYPAGLLGCALAGTINGLGSLLYYGSLGRIDASLGQLLYSLYPLFVALWLWLDHQPPGKLTLARLALAIPAVYLLTQSPANQMDWIGIGMMLASSALYALHLPINQRVLYDMPAPTVTLYTLLSMSMVVLSAYLFASFGNNIPQPAPQAWSAVIGLTLVTFFSRLTLFLGVKNLGGLQTALLGLGELLIAVLGAHLLLGERLTMMQWLGLGILVLNLSLAGLDRQPLRPANSRGWLRWISPPSLPPDIPWQPH
ncbi:MAG: hypothetical protein Fur0018_12680 [Anaerolineales bacterium]